MNNLNLFSIFDSSTSMYLSMNWLSSMFLILFIPLIYWMLPSRFIYLFYLINLNLIIEIKSLFNLKINKLNIIMFISLFIMIMLNNFLGLFSYIFTSSSHLIFSMTFSLLFWLIFMLFGWIKNTNNMFIHLVPQNTPNLLMNFMVLIETISNFIRPLTLSVRLSANMIAGHLLIVLISNNNSNLMIIMLIFMLFIQNLLMILELSVSFIQAYIFTILSLLYKNEIL